MDEIQETNINLNQRFSNNVVRVERRVIFKFFSTCSFISKSGKPFLIKSIMASGHNYVIKDLESTLNSKGVLKCTLYYPKGDERPFFMIIENEHNVKEYFGIKKFDGIQFEPLDELNTLDPRQQEKQILGVLKKLFTIVFSSVLRLSEGNIRYRVSYDGNLRFDITMDDMFYKGFERWVVRPNMAHSLSAIILDSTYLWFDKKLEFVRELSLYYKSNDTSIPLIMQTLDYEIGNDKPLHNYYKRAMINGTKWSVIDSGSDLVEPLCRGDLIRILEQELVNYNTHPITFDISRIIRPSFKTIFFDGVPFSVQYQSGLRHEFFLYEPKISKFFYIEKIVSEKEKLDIDTDGTQYEWVRVYSLLKDDLGPSLICMKLHRTQSDGTQIFLWYAKEVQRNTWKRIHFDGDPGQDFHKIDNLINDLNKPTFELLELKNAIKWLCVFTLGAIVGGWIGARFGGRIRRLIPGIYRLMGLGGE